MKVVFPDRESEGWALLRAALVEVARAHRSLVAFRRRALVGFFCAVGVIVLGVVYPGEFWGWLPFRFVVGLVLGWSLGGWWVSRRCYRRMTERFGVALQHYVEVFAKTRLREWVARSIR